MVYDLIVLGSGPAGLSAALGARGRNKSVLVIGNPWQDSPLAKAPRVDNYLGVPAVTGREMLEQFAGQVQQAGAELVTGRAVSLMEYEGFYVTVGSEVYQSRALILAPGAMRAAPFDGEEGFLGAGVSYCATCDGMLYRGKPVVVVGLGHEAPQEANYLQSIGCQVTYVADKRPQALAEEIPFVPKTGWLDIQGLSSVTGVRLNFEQVIPCDGVFILRDTMAPTSLLPTLETEGGVVKVDRTMATNIPGVYAAGDCTGAPLQIAKAVGEGHIAALSACTWLDAQK